MRFERQRRHVIYDPKGDIYRVTWDPVFSDSRTTKDPSRHLVGISSALDFWEGVDGSRRCLCCAKTVKAAWESGDRYLLDTESARSKAELVADLACTEASDEDLCTALIDLRNEIAGIRLSSIPMESFDVLPVCEKALERCFSTPEFNDWSPSARRRKFIYSLRQSDRSELICTLASLYFNHGQTSLLTLRQRKELLSLPREDGLPGSIKYFSDCLSTITSYLFR